MRQAGFTIGWENDLKIEDILRLVYKYSIAEASYQEIYEDAFNLVGESGMIADSLADYITELDPDHFDDDQLSVWLVYKSAADEVK